MRPIEGIFAGWKAMLKSENQFLRDMRMSDCEKCPKFKDYWLGPVCGECGCYLEAKTRCFLCECPLGKWIVE